MSASVTDKLPAKPPRRVRDEVKDGLAVAAFTAVASSALALALMLVVHVGS